MKPVFSLPLRVYIEDTDIGGIVYYVNYLKYMERARSEFMRSLGWQHDSMAQLGRLWVVHSAQLNYRRPARMDDELLSSLSLRELGAASLVFEQQISRAGEVLCEGLIRVACVDRQALKPVPLPAVIRTALCDFTGKDA